MPPASRQNRPPLYVNLVGGQEYEYRPALVNGVLQWVLRPVYTLAYWIQRFIRRMRAAIDFGIMGYGLRNTDGAAWGKNWGKRHSDGHTWYESWRKNDKNSQTVILEKR